MNVPAEKPGPGPNERAFGLAFAQYIRHDTNRAQAAYCDKQGLPGRLAPDPRQGRKRFGLAQLRLAYEAGDDDDSEVITLPVQHADAPRLFPVPSAWWDTPAVTSRSLSPQPEDMRHARQFVREMLTCWGLADLADDAEMIVGELVVNAVRHGLRTAPPRAAARAGRGDDPGLRLCLLRRNGEIMMAVIDPSNEAPQPRQAGWTGESGRGLQIIGALSHLWGWSPLEGNGKAVWAVLRFP
jgi:anti-sigma regulatory factor (Ser/Thr protein kinase)